jgi:hypothetical membrane protein
MLRYPGGTLLDHSTRGYSLTHNFLSDLGMTVAWGGEANRLGAFLFVAGLGGRLPAFIRLYSRSPVSRRLARAAGVTGLLVCAAFIGVAVTPENRVMPLHVRFTLLAFRIFPAVPLFLTVASLHQDTIRKRVAALWALLTAVLIAYVAVLGWGPALDTSQGVVIQVIAQKIVAIAAVSIMAYQSYQAERATHAAELISTGRPRDVASL